MAKLFRPPSRSSGDKKPMQNEERLEDIKFNVFKFNNRPKPHDSQKIMFVTCFSEFGCESIGLHYCLPRIVSSNPGFYKIAVGWYGREYLYRHLVDEYWEIKEEHQWLREYCRAFHHESINISRIEKNLAKMGQLVPGSYMGNLCLGNTCVKCQHFWPDGKYVEQCEKCQGKDIVRSLFGDVKSHKPQMLPIPKPSQECMNRADQYLKPNAVGIFARARKSYGRNLPPEFYVSLIALLEKMGYNPIWLGEKQSTLPCPVDHIVDFSRMEESKDLELTLAIVSKLQFTVQFWTASTRFAAMMGVPYLLFESPDQIIGMGQEGIRMALVTQSYDKKKLVFCHYLNVLEKQPEAINLVQKAIEEMNDGNWDDIVGMVENQSLIAGQIKEKNMWSRI